MEETTKAKIIRWIAQLRREEDYRVEYATSGDIREMEIKWMGIISGRVRAIRDEECANYQSELGIN